MRRAALAAVLLALLAGGCAHAPRADSPPAVVRIAVISDLNSSYGSTEYEPEVHEALRRIREEWRPDLVLASGDLIAGQRPTLSDSTVRAMWAAFDTAVFLPLRAAGIPFGFALGNHDASPYPAHSRDRALALEYWRTRRGAAGLNFVDDADFPFNYAFTHGDLFVLVWDATNEELARRPETLQRVRTLLASEAARRARVRLVVGHLPLYAVAVGRDRAGEVLAEPDSLRALLERHDVHTYVSGHHHAYYPARAGALELLHTGALGQGARQLVGSDAPPVQSVTLLEIGADGAVRDRTYALERAGGAVRLRPLRPEELPGRICALGRCVDRRDLAPAGR